MYIILGKFLKWIREFQVIDDLDSQVALDQRLYQWFIHMKYSKKGIRVDKNRRL